MKIAKKQSMQEMYGSMLLWLGALADEWCPLSDWEHLLTQNHGLLLSESWQDPALPNGKFFPTHHLFNCFS
jgi:hypothetical protein